MPRFIALLGVSILLFGCTPIAGQPAASSTEITGPSPTATPSPPTPAPTPALPAFVADEPLYLFNHLTGVGGGVFVMRPDGTGKTQLATDILPGVHKRGDWSPDGQRVVFIDETTERMWLAHLDGSPTAEVAACHEGRCDFPAWSPDGTKIAFSRYENGAAAGPAAVAVYVLDLDSGTEIQAIRLARPRLADVPRWSPDGTELLISVDEMDADAYETGSALAIVPATGGEPRYITDFSMFAASHDWNRVTGEIAFSTDYIELKRSPDPGDETWNLWGVQPDGSGLRQITDVASGRQVKGVRWSADGASIGSYDMDANHTILVDPVTGVISPNLTSGPETIPIARPLP